MDRHSPWETASAIILTVIYAVLPMIILPVTNDPVGNGKIMALGASCGIVLFLWLVRLVFQAKASINRSPVALSVVPLAVYLWVHAVFFSVNRTDAIFSVTGPLTVSAIAIILILGGSFDDHRIHAFRRWVFLSLAAVVGIIVVYQNIGITASLAKNLGLVGDTGTTPIGPLPVALAYLVISLPVAVGKTLESRKNGENDAVAAVSGFLTVIIAAGAVTSIVSMIHSPPQMLPFVTGWSILLESAKSVRNLFLGVGLDRYANAFMAYRPVEFNTSPVWALSFSRGPGLLFDITTTTGMIGGAICVWIFREQWVWFFRHRKSSGGCTELISYSAWLLAVLLVPPVAGLWIVFLMVCGILDYPEIRSVKVRIPGILILTPLVIVAIAAEGYALYRFEGGEIAIERSSRAVKLGNSVQAYGYAVQAIKFMPTDEEYRIVASQLSMNLGQGLLTEVLKASSSATPQDRETADKLINQSIREAKTAIVVAPDNAYAWTNLATLYQNIVGVGQNADQYAVSAYRNAIRLDPQNPVLRLDLGNLYVSLNQYDQATTQFLAALTLKPDYANAEFNLANVLMKKGDYDNALKALEQTRGMIANNEDSLSKIEQMETEIAKMQKTVRSNEPSPTTPPQQ